MSMVDRPAPVFRSPEHPGLAQWNLRWRDCTLCTVAVQDEFTISNL